MAPLDTLILTKLAGLIPIVKPHLDALTAWPILSSDKAIYRQTLEKSGE